VTNTFAQNVSSCLAHTTSVWEQNIFKRFTEHSLYVANLLPQKYCARKQGNIFSKNIDLHEFPCNSFVLFAGTSLNE